MVRTTSGAWFASSSEHSRGYDFDEARNDVSVVGSFCISVNKRPPAQGLPSCVVGGGATMQDERIGKACALGLRLCRRLDQRTAHDRAALRLGPRHYHRMALVHARDCPWATTAASSLNYVWIGVCGCGTFASETTHAMACSGVTAGHFVGLSFFRA